MFDKLGDLHNLMKQAQRVQEEMKRVQAELADQVVEGTAGGGMVTARVNGHQELVGLKIEREVVNPDDVELLSDLIVAAVTQAMRKSQDLAKDAYGRLTGGIKIPGLTA